MLAGHKAVYDQGVLQNRFNEEWLRQSTLAIRVRAPCALLRATIQRATIQPFPTFSEIFADSLHALHAAVRKPVGAR
jgi:dihydrolipoamide dehydrogenase